MLFTFAPAGAEVVQRGPGQVADYRRHLVPRMRWY